MHTEDEHGQLGVELVQLLQHVEAAPAAERDVEHDGVPFLFAHLPERFARIAGFAEKGRARLLVEHAPDAGAHDFVVVNNEESDHRPGWARVRRRPDEFSRQRTR